MGPFRVVGPSGGFSGGRFGSPQELGVGGEHRFVVGGFGGFGGRSVGGEGLFAEECELTEVENLEGGVEGGFEFGEFEGVGGGGDGVVGGGGGGAGEFFDSGGDDLFGLGAKVGDDAVFVYDFTAGFFDLNSETV